MQTSALDKLLAVAELVDEHAEDPELVAWFAGAVARYLATTLSLDELLGLSAADRTDRRRADRDRRIREAWRLIEPDRPSARARADELERQWRRVVDCWQASGRPPEPPARSSKLRAALWQATVSNDGGALGSRQIRRVIGDVAMTHDDDEP